MTEAEARARLATKLAPDMEPAFTAPEIDALIRGARRSDATGLLPGAEGWTPTWTASSVDDAVADGWEIRAGRATSGFDFATDGQRFNRSQIHAQCMAMARLYRRGSGSVRVPSQVVDDASRPVTLGGIG